MRSDIISAERLTWMYLKRIEAYEDSGPAINAYLHINTNALREARRLDRLGHHDRHGLSRKPLYGVPRPPECAVNSSLARIIAFNESHSTDVSMGRQS